LTKNKFGKLVRLVGFIITKFVTMQGHMNVNVCACIACLPGIDQHHLVHIRALMTQFNAEIRLLHWHVQTVPSVLQYN
jgi:hypothetical protein